MTNGRYPPVINTYSNYTLNISPIALTESQLHRRKILTKNPNAQIGLKTLLPLEPQIYVDFSLSSWPYIHIH